MLPVFNSSPDEDLHNFSPSPVSKLLEELSLDCRITDETPDSAILNGKAEDQSYLHLNGKETDGGRESSQSSPMSFHNFPVKQKPPAVLKKPKLSFLPSFIPEPVNEQLPSQNEHTTTLSQKDQVDALQRQTKDEEESEQQEEEDFSESTEPLARSSEAFTEVKNEYEISASASQETSLDYGLCTNGEAHEEAEEEGDGTSSTTGSISSKEDDAGKFD